MMKLNFKPMHPKDKTWIVKSPNARLVDINFGLNAPSESLFQIIINKFNPKEITSEVVWRLDIWDPPIWSLRLIK